MCCWSDLWEHQLQARSINSWSQIGPHSPLASLPVYWSPIIPQGAGIRDKHEKYHYPQFLFFSTSQQKSSKTHGLDVAQFISAVIGTNSGLMPVWADSWTVESCSPGHTSTIRVRKLICVLVKRAQQYCTGKSHSVSCSVQTDVSSFYVINLWWGKSFY